MVKIDITWFLFETLCNWGYLKSMLSSIHNSDLMSQHIVCIKTHTITVNFKVIFVQETFI